MNDLEERAQMVSSLTKHPGFELLESMLKASAQSAYDAMMSAKDPHSMAKHAGSHFALTQILTWPARELAVIKAQLKQDTEENLHPVE